MIDIHTHILFKTDDGVKDIDESISILKKMSEKNITDVFFTPHYIEYSRYTSNIQNNIDKFNELKNALDESNIKINIHLGNEIYITRDILKLLNNNELKPLGNSKYLLIELPISGEFNDFMDIFLNLKELGYKVILAHPERYIYFQDNIDELLKIHEYGILFQINLESILGKYGRYAKKTVIKLLKNKVVDFTGSDIHHDHFDYSFIDKAINKFKKYLNDEEINLITNENAKNILI